MENLQPTTPNQEQNIWASGISDPEQAQKFIDELIDKGERPYVSIPKQYISSVLEEGLKPHATWVPGFRKIVGTLGREPFEPDFPKEERVVVRIKEIDKDKIHPRFTGPDKSFHGVVIFDGPIDPNSVELLDF